MIRPLVLTATLIFAAPAGAQELVYSNAATNACLDASGSAAMKYACIGASAALCMTQTPGGGSTVGMNGCLDRERTYWDNRLNRIYGRLRMQERRAGIEGELQAMQRAWIAYRDTRCAYEAAQWAGGTGAGPALTACLMQTTGEQALVLRSFER